MLTSGPYSNGFYSLVEEGASRSARAVVPIVMDLLDPRSVVDVGCGLGTWLWEFRRCGVFDALGIDGPWIDTARFALPADRFRAADLRTPLHIERRFDLAVSLEVAEHLPERCAATFVASLVALAPAVLFSAAVPHQGGVDHVNEQWPEYWAALFATHGYIVVDCVRPRIWGDTSVDYWYAQNVLLFVRADHLNRHTVLKQEAAGTRPAQLSLVHPRRYLRDAAEIAGLREPLPAGMLLSAFPAAVAGAVRRRLASRHHA